MVMDDRYEVWVVDDAEYPGDKGRGAYVGGVHGR